jgi:DNA-3-methyladenine glycosylase II
MPPVALATAIDAVASADPVLARLVSLVGPIRYRPRNPDGHFGALVRAIVFQQLAGHAANAIFQRVRALVDGPLTPAALLAVPDNDLKGAGLSKAKLASLRDLSAKVMDGTVVLGGASRMADEEIITRLVLVRGIGRWTAEMYLMFELRRLDVWPVDDLGVRQGYALAWSLDGPRPRASCSPSVTASGLTVRWWRGTAGRRLRSPAGEPTPPCGSDAAGPGAARETDPASWRRPGCQQPCLRQER